MALTLITNTILVNPQSQLHLKAVNILIEDGIIQTIGEDTIKVDDDDLDEVFDAEGAYCSLGWTDLRCQSGEPGLESRETLESLALTAANGGFTHVCILPNTKPTISTRQMVAYFKNAETESPVSFHPIGSLTKNLDGKHLAEMMDMADAGVTLFAEAGAIADADILLKSLQYSAMTGAAIIDRPEDHHISAFGQMHEGEQSTLLGLKGIPPLSELLAVQRNLTLLEYAGGTLHLSCISTKESVEAIRNAKAKGLNVTASIAAHQLSFLDTDLAEFDTYLKVHPPFRSQEHKEALLAGLLDGTIDAVETDHTPLDTESKYLEFDLATPGIAGLQTAYPALLTATDISVEQTAQLFSYRPRAIAQIPVYEIEAGEMADLTFFHPEINTLVNTDIWSSLSNNSPFFNQKLKGAVLAVYHKGQLHMC